MLDGYVPPYSANKCGSHVQTSIHHFLDPSKQTSPKFVYKSSGILDDLPREKYA
jgi:hypothetical protein